MDGIFHYTPPGEHIDQQLLASLQNPNQAQLQLAPAWCSVSISTMHCQTLLCAADAPSMLDLYLAMQMRSKCRRKADFRRMFNTFGGIASLANVCSVFVQGAGRDTCHTRCHKTTVNYSDGSVKPVCMCTGS